MEGVHKQRECAGGRRVESPEEDLELDMEMS